MRALGLKRVTETPCAVVTNEDDIVDGGEVKVGASDGEDAAAENAPRGGGNTGYRRGEGGGKQHAEQQRESKRHGYLRKSGHDK